ncbi:hypothetical protein WR25_23695 [Diploscapter pachys]|uniref:Uncharacterized protein n=1 Tax=Diploscapter pachys TaxID=2018661 RepID=A0A2A2M4B5_9BILA|nr:hypothetical protein WR25_23695 [Diploscapter pachys]
MRAPVGRGVCASSRESPYRDPRRQIVSIMSVSTSRHETARALERSPDQPYSASGLGSWSLNGISSVTDTAPKRCANWLVDIDRLALPALDFS